MPPPAIIAELKRLHAATTQEEWWVLPPDERPAHLPDNIEWTADYHIVIGEQEDRVAEFHEGECRPAENAAFIAAAHNHLPALLAALESAEAENAKAESLLKRAQDFLNREGFDEGDLYREIDQWLAKHKETTP